MNTEPQTESHATEQATRPSIEQIMRMTPAQKARIPAWHVLNLSIKKSCSEHDYGAAISGVILWPLFWPLSYLMKCHYSREARKAQPVPDANHDSTASELQEKGESK